MIPCGEIEEQWFVQLADDLDRFCKRVDDKIDKEQEQLKACKKKNELESKLALEIKLHKELSQQLAELDRRGADLERVCATFETLNIAESDQNRLDNAKEMYQLAKELTGVRLDFSASSEVAKGYVKNEARRVLQPFDLPATDSNSLWQLIKTTSDPAWRSDKENRPPK